MLASISIKSFRSFGSLDKIKLDRLTLLHGRPGSGRTNFNLCFSLLRNHLLRLLPGFSKSLGGTENLRHFGKPNPVEFRLDFKLEQGLVTYDVTLAPDFAVEEEFLSLQPPGEEPIFTPLSPTEEGTGFNAAASSGIGLAMMIRPYLYGLQQFNFGGNFYRLKIGRDRAQKHLHSDGGNLFPYLHRIHAEAPAHYEMILGTMRAMFPQLQEFVFQPGEDNVQLLWRMRGIASPLPAMYLGDGALRLLCLAAALAEPPSSSPSPKTIVIDDLDLGMSPETIDILANLVLRSRHQIIATVRSAEFAEALDEAKGSVRVLSFVHSGGETSITDTTPKLSEYESLGDAWEDPMF
jgi:predicted ATPase